MADAGIKKWLTNKGYSSITIFLYFKAISTSF